MGRAGGAVDHPLLDPLEDPRQAEEVVGKQPVHVGQGVPAGGGAIAFDHFIELGNAQRLAIKIGDAGAPRIVGYPGHRDVGKIAERIAQGRKLPVEHGQHPGLILGPDHVVDPVIAMDHAGAGLFGQRCRQPFDQPLHVRHVLGLGQLVLLGPAIDLAAEIVAGLAEVGEADSLHIDIVQCSQGVDHREIGVAAVSGRGAGHGPVPDRFPVDHVHDVEPRADHRVIGAQAELPRRRKAGLVERVLDLVFAVDRVGAGQQRAERLAPQNIVAALRLDLVGRVRLPALELGQAQRALEAIDIGLHPLAQARLVQLVGAFRLDRADKGFVRVDRCRFAHTQSPSTLSLSKGCTFLRMAAPTARNKDSPSTSSGQAVPGIGGCVQLSNTITERAEAPDFIVSNPSLIFSSGIRSAMIVSRSSSPRM